MKKTTQTKKAKTPIKQIATSKQDMLMESLTKYFKDSNALKQMIPILTQCSKISLRLLDWVVTNYAKRENISYFIEEIKGGRPSSRYFNVYLNYKSQLKAYSKQQFDPFCRKWKIIKGKKIYCGIKFYYAKTKEGKRKFIETTVGQLNFFRWAISNDVLEYVEENFNDIAHDMLKSVSKKSKKKDTKKKVTKKKVTKKKVTIKGERNKKEETSKVEIKEATKASTEKPVKISATKQLTKRQVSIIVDFS